MNGQFIEKFKMDTYSLLALVAILLSMLTLVILSLVFRNLLKRQIDEQMKEMIPIKAIRKRIGIRFNLRKL